MAGNLGLTVCRPRAQLDELLDALDRLWTPNPVEHKGTRWSILKSWTCVTCITRETLKPRDYVIADIRLDELSNVKPGAHPPSASGTQGIRGDWLFRGEP
jgi:hypothetical protein